MRALVEDVDVALDDARGGCGHLADDEADFRAVLGERYSLCRLSAGGSVTWWKPVATPPRREAK
jgi:hypothetical protein